MENMKEQLGQQQDEEQNEQTPQDNNPAFESEQESTINKEQPLDEVTVPKPNKKYISEAIEENTVEDVLEMTAESPKESEEAAITTADSDSEEAPATIAEEDDDAHEDEEEHEDSDEHEEEHEEEVNFESLSLQELLAFVKAAAEKPQGKDINRKVQAVRAEFNNRLSEKKQETLEKWLADGNEEDDFEMKPDPLAEEFSQVFRHYKKNRKDHIAQLNQAKLDNLAAKKHILERLKVITEQDETGSSLEEVRKLQNEWKQIGHVPITEVENLWNTYHFYLDKFYEHRSLYSEFKELDRKKNFEAKQEVISHIEKLDELENIGEVMKSLRQLQEEWRHIGPVPREDYEAITQRYKDAVLKIYEKKEKLSEELQKRREQNYEAKLALVEKIAEIAEFTSDRVQSWIDKNTELGQWIEKWRNIGSVPVNKAEELRERFTEAVRKFNKNKNDFFKDRKKEKVDNLKKKTDLCERVDEILKSDDLQSHRKEVIRLQDSWKKIGPVPGKYSDKIWKRFQSTCDVFFSKLNEQFKEQNKEQIDNLERKNALIERAEQLAAQENIENIEDEIRGIQEEWNNVGFVPFKEKDKIRKKFSAAMNGLFNKLKKEGGEDEDGSLVAYRLMVQGWAQTGGDKRLIQEERKLHRDISKIENEISTLENNMEFISGSKTADKLKGNLERQIDGLRDKLQDLKQKVKIIRTT